MQSFLKNGSLTWKASFQDRYGASMAFNDISKHYFSVPFRPFWLLDINAQWSFKTVAVFAELSNALNKKYIDTGSAIQEGRNLKVGFALNFNFR
jgi:outer membrane receptor protein involved in Fe transport